ncbi:MAG TPA: TonB family protein [Candidatus Cybelea sp.]|nr:TonB family protein [Candidatus Cybelea sp.]
MPDAARIAQAQALEVPLVLKGAKPDDGTGRRELFTENATTILVFDNGALLNLRARLAVGQAVLIHNEQNRREILSKVLEAPPVGEVGHTELEFTTADPDFWLADAPPSALSPELPQAATEDQEPKQPPEAPSEDTLAMMSETASKIQLPAVTPPAKQPVVSLREELVPAHQMVPETSPVTVEPLPGTEQTEPTGEQIDAALKQMAGAALPPSSDVPGAQPHSESGAGNEQTQDERHLAALMAREARFAKFVAIKEKQLEKNQRDAATKNVEDVPPEALPVTEQKVVLSAKQKALFATTELIHKLTYGRNAIFTQIGAGVVVAVALGFLCHTLRPVFFPEKSQPVATAPQVKPAAAAAPTPAPPSPGSAAAVAAVPPAAVAGSPIPTPPVAVAAPAKLAAAKSVQVDSGEVASGQPRHRNAIEANTVGNVPIRILSQPQPTLPPWAKGLDVSGVVTLDVVIDEKGDVAQTKVLSGPRELQHAAEQAVGLWLFKPAQSAGRPVAKHVVLTVEFQQ